MLLPLFYFFHFFIITLVKWAHTTLTLRIIHAEEDKILSLCALSETSEFVHWYNNFPGIFDRWEAFTRTKEMSCFYSEGSTLEIRSQTNIRVERSPLFLLFLFFKLPFSKRPTSFATVYLFGYSLIFFFFVITVSVSEIIFKNCVYYMKRSYRNRK